MNFILGCLLPESITLKLGLILEIQNAKNVINYVNVIKNNHMINFNNIITNNHIIVIKFSNVIMIKHNYKINHKTIYFSFSLIELVETIEGAQTHDSYSPRRSCKTTRAIQTTTWYTRSPRTHL